MSSCPQLYLENIEGANAVRMPYMLNTLLGMNIHAALVGSSGIGKRQTLNALLLHCATCLSMDAGDTLIADGSFAAPTIVTAGSAIDEHLRRFAVTPKTQLKLVLIRINRKVFHMESIANGNRVKVTFVPSAGPSYENFCRFVREKRAAACSLREIVALLELDEAEVSQVELQSLHVRAAMAVNNRDTYTLLHGIGQCRTVLKVLADMPSQPAMIAMAKEQFTFDPDQCHWAVHDDGTRAANLADALQIVSDRVAVVGCVPRVVLGNIAGYLHRWGVIKKGPACLPKIHAQRDCPEEFFCFGFQARYDYSRDEQCIQDGRPGALSLQRQAPIYH